MEEKLLSLEVNVASERREACEWLSLTSQVEEQRYRQFSADLERRRRQKYNLHLEERKKVEKELDNLQKDRQRFEREKQLRRRKSFSSAKTKTQSSKSQNQKDKNDFPLHGEGLGGSASIAFEPKVEKYTRRRRKAKIDMSSKTKKDEKQSNNEEKPTNFPYLSENDVKNFHKSCKSAGLRSECRRWGAAWLYAKKEQDLTMNQDKRWKSLLLNAEKEKMRTLSAKWSALQERRVSTCWTPTSICDKQFPKTDSKRLETNTKSKENKAADSIAFKEHCENIKSAKLSATIPSNQINGRKGSKIQFVSSFSKLKVLKAVNAWPQVNDCTSSSSNSTTTEDKCLDGNRTPTAKLQVIKEATKSSNPKTSTSIYRKETEDDSFLPDL